MDQGGDMKATLNADEFAQLLGVSTWSIYASVKRGDCSVEPIRIGHRLVTLEL